MRVFSKKKQRGASLTEMVIVAPLFVMLVMWSQYFADLGVLRLKVEEASRYALWESVVGRAPNAIASDVQTRFRDLDSSTASTGSVIKGVLSFRNPMTMRVTTYNNNLDAKFSTAQAIGAPPVSNTGVINVIMGAVLTLLADVANKAIDALIGLMQFNASGSGYILSQVSFSTKDAMMPRLRNGRGVSETQLATATGQNNLNLTGPKIRLLTNTWKSWPGAYSINKNTTATPQSTYNDGGANTAEAELTERLKNVAFFGLNNIPVVGSVISSLNSILSTIGAVGAFEVSAGQGYSTVAMRPGARSASTWSPSYNKRTRRLGGIDIPKLADNGTTIWQPSVWGGTPDRARYSTPGYISTDYWKYTKVGVLSQFYQDPQMGGMGGNLATNTYRQWNQGNLQSPYVKMTQCRGGYYLGSASPNNRRYGKSLSAWATTAFGNGVCR